MTFKQLPEAGLKSYLKITLMERSHLGAMMMPMNGRPQPYRTPPMPGAPIPPIPTPGMPMSTGQLPPQPLGMTDLG